MITSINYKQQEKLIRDYEKGNPNKQMHRVSWIDSKAIKKSAKLVASYIIGSIFYRSAGNASML